MTESILSKKTIKELVPKTQPRRLSKILEYFFLDAFCATLIISLFLRHNNLLIQLDAIFLASFVFLFLFNWQYYSDQESCQNKEERAKKYEQLMESSNDPNSRLKLERENALRYCQELIDSYTKTRQNARNGYYFFQISTIIFSGVTPVLVLVDKLDNSPAWIKWLPVIFPAIASIVASLSTSFPLETIWKEANIIVENLEAEQEKFILGIGTGNESLSEGTGAEATEAQKQHLKIAIINFVNKVNDIHLNQMKTQTTTAQTPAETPTTTESGDTGN